MTKSIRACSPCPKCSTFKTRVVCTKRDEKTNAVIRRRHCYVCNHRWYTMQYPEVVIRTKEVKWIGKNGSNAQFVALDNVLYP